MTEDSLHNTYLGPNDQVLPQDDPQVAKLRLLSLYELYDCAKAAHSHAGFTFNKPIRNYFKFRFIGVYDLRHDGDATIAHVHHRIRDNRWAANFGNGEGSINRAYLEDLCDKEDIRDTKVA